jgi:ABC-type phosphate transport system substrate-binding protein
VVWAALVLLLLAGVVAGHALAGEPTPEFRVVVHKDNGLTSLSRSFVTDAFLKKVTSWKDGERIRPVDQRPDAAVRHKFSESVLRRSVAAVRSYWQQKIFSGRDVPPPELDSDEKIVTYVESHVGAIGYVSGDAKLGEARQVTVH